MAEKRPTILQIIPELDTGGAELSTIEIADAIERRRRPRHRADRGRPPGAAPARHRRRGAVLSRRREEPLPPLWNAHRIANVIRRDGVDLVHARSRAPAWSALMAARAHGRAVRHDLPRRLFGEARTPSGSTTASWRAATSVIANSHYTSDLIRMRYGTPLRSLRVIYRGVDDRLFDPVNVAPERVAAVRKRVGHRRTSKRVILHAARLTRWKGQKVVIEAARLLASRAGSTTPCSFSPATRRGAAPTAAAEQRRSAGRLDRARAHRRPRRRHGGGLPAPRTSRSSPRSSRRRSGARRRRRRSWATPVIATDIGAPPETVLSAPRVARRRATGWLVPPDDARAARRGAGRGARLDARGAHRAWAHAPARTCARLLARADEAADAAGLRRAARHARSREPT